MMEKLAFVLTGVDLYNGHRFNFFSPAILLPKLLSMNLLNILLIVMAVHTTLILSTELILQKMKFSDGLMLR